MTFLVLSMSRDIWWHKTFCLRFISDHSEVGWVVPTKIGSAQVLSALTLNFQHRLDNYNPITRASIIFYMFKCLMLKICSFYIESLHWQWRLRMSLPIKGWCCPHILASRNKPRDYHHLGLTFIHLGWRNNLEPFRNYALKIFQFSAHIIPRKYNLNFI